MNCIRIITLVGCLLLCSCAGHNPVNARFHQYFDFSNVKSYSTFARNSDFIDFQNLSDSLRNHIELAIENALEQQGFQFAPPDNADLLVGYHLITHKPKELTAYNEGVKYCAPCLLTASGHKPKSLVMKPGSLIIDLIDPKTERSIWRSSISVNLKTQDNSQEQQSKIQIAVAQMLQLYPHDYQKKTSTATMENS